MATQRTIRKGDFGSDVAAWQRIVGAPVTSTFDLATESATKRWQAAKGLAADGIVGPISWGTAEGKAVPSRATPADLQAYAVTLRAAPTLPESERQYALTVARGEGFYGLGWKPGEGAGSNNWGAVQGQGSAGSFQHIDHHADGREYTTAFKAYRTPDEGFLDMARILLKPNVRAALAEGDLKAAVDAQHANGYFELDPKKYLEAVERNYKTLTSSGVFRGVLNLPGVLGALVTPGRVLVLGVLVGVGVAAALATSKAAHP